MVAVMRLAFDCPLDLTHIVMRDKAVKQYYIGLLLLAHKVHLLYKAFLSLSLCFGQPLSVRISNSSYMFILCVYTF